MSGLSELAANIRKLATDVPIQVNELAKQIASVMLEELATTTPADTGAAISNWQVTLDAPGEGILPTAVPSPKGHTKDGIWIHKVDPSVTASNNAPTTIENGEAVIQAKIPGQALYISNNIGYVNQLNFGTSVQAPAGFVDNAVILAQSVMDNL